MYRKLLRHVTLADTFLQFMKLLQNHFLPQRLTASSTGHFCNEDTWADQVVPHAFPYDRGPLDMGIAFKSTVIVIFWPDVHLIPMLIGPPVYVTTQIFHVFIPIWYVQELQCSQYTPKAPYNSKAISKTVIYRDTSLPCSRGLIFDSVIRYIRHKWPSFCHGIQFRCQGDLDFDHSINGTHRHVT